MTWDAKHTMNMSGQYSSTIKSCDGPEGDAWSYREASQGAVMGAMVFAAFVVGISILFAGSSFKEKLPFILLLLVLIAMLLWSLKMVTTVVINRKDATICKDEGSLIFSRSRRYSLYDFNRLTINEQLQTGEEGYPLTVYSLALQGPILTLALISTNDKAEAERLRDDLVSYLGFPVGSSPVESLHAVVK